MTGITLVTILLLAYSTWRWVLLRLQEGQQPLLWMMIHISVFTMLVVVSHGVETFVYGHAETASVVIDYTIAVFALVVSVLNFFMVTGRYGGRSLQDDNTS